MTDRTSAALFGDILKLVEAELTDEPFILRQRVLDKIWRFSWHFDFAQEDVHEDRLLKKYGLWEDD